jgi:hypothetical protein
MARSSLGSQSMIDSDGWDILSPRSAAGDMLLMGPRSNHGNPQDLDLYTTRPLPSLPSTSVSPLNLSTDYNSNKRKPQDEEINSKLKVSCRPGKDNHSVGKAITDIPTEECTSTLDAFLQDQQNHERLAMGLDGVPRSFLSYRRASEQTKGVKRNPQSRRKGEQDQKDKRENDQDEKGL